MYFAGITPMYLHLPRKSALKLTPESTLQNFEREMKAEELKLSRSKNKYIQLGIGKN